MYWRNCKHEPPSRPNCYWVLRLTEDGFIPDIAMFYGDELGWSLVNSEENSSVISYWMPITAAPPTPKREDEETCYYYQKETDEYGYCIGRKLCPRCSCQGSKQRCEKEYLDD